MIRVPLWTWYDNTTIHQLIVCYTLNDCIGWGNISDSIFDSYNGGVASNSVNDGFGYYHTLLIFHFVINVFQMTATPVLEDANLSLLNKFTLHIRAYFPSLSKLYELCFWHNILFVVETMTKQWKYQMLMRLHSQYN